MLENECVTRSVWFYDNLPELQLLSVAAVKCGFSYCDDDGEERQLTRCTSLLPDAKYPESWKPSDTVQLPVSRILLSVQQTYIQISTYDVFPVWHGRRDIHHEIVWINNTSSVDVCIESRCVGSVGRHSDAHRVSTGRMRTPCHILCKSACNDTWSWTGLHTHATTIYSLSAIGKKHMGEKMEFGLVAKIQLENIRSKEWTFKSLAQTAFATRIHLLGRSVCSNNKAIAVHLWSFRWQTFERLTCVAGIWMC